MKDVILEILLFAGKFFNKVMHKIRVSKHNTSETMTTKVLFGYHQILESLPTLIH